MDESAGKVENEKTTITNIVTHCSDEMTHSDELDENALYGYFLGKDGSEMKHIQKYYKVKTYIPEGIRQPERCNCWRERNHEDQAVPSVMKLIEKLTDEEVDEMIPEIDVDDTQCSEQIVDVPVPQIAERIVEIVTAFHGSESRVVAQTVNMSTHTVVERIVKDSQSHAASCRRTGCGDCLKARHPAVK